MGMLESLWMLLSQLLLLLSRFTTVGVVAVLVLTDGNFRVSAVSVVDDDDDDDDAINLKESLLFSETFS
ncbi:Hypothetical predicted protein [Octopus vulgaris]|uniref:Uncharacterized protein n=1 Tax=Octopus vulgaris TaxID=6645 RepID=A0AA36BM98_OCTVU|nr:Hypothetical predicted protein [Octopus vulgaris]